MHPPHEELLEILKTAFAACAEGDAPRYQAALAALSEWRSRPLQTVLARLARELSDSLAAIEAPAPVDAASELPDARARLDHVLHISEQAAHRTLDCIDDGRRNLEALAAHALPGACAPFVDGLRRNLSEMALAQEYQDLSGQLIRRVAGVVQRVESALAELGAAASPPHRPAVALAGPAVPGVDHAAVSQDDADALLAGLGL